MLKWPKVPAVYGWLSLTARGEWKVKGEPIDNESICDFIGRNYTNDGSGNWFFQNGPQRVYVSLEATRTSIGSTSSGVCRRTPARIHANCAPRFPTRQGGCSSRPSSGRALSIAPTWSSFPNVSSIETATRSTKAHSGVSSPATARHTLKPTDCTCCTKPGCRSNARGHRTSGKLSASSLSRAKVRSPEARRCAPSRIPEIRRQGSCAAWDSSWCTAGAPCGPGTRSVWHRTPRAPLRESRRESASSFPDTG
jgi:hypothetical protein